MMRGAGRVVAEVMSEVRLVPFEVVVVSSFPTGFPVPEFSIPGLTKGVTAA